MTTQVQNIRVDQIVPGDNDRERFDPEGLRELADSIKQHGLAQPITLRILFHCQRCQIYVTATPGDPYEYCECFGGQSWTPRYQIVAGERRWRAVQLLGWAHIPALVRTLDDEAASSIMLLENIQRAELNPMEEARAYQKRMDQFGWDEEQVAQVANVPVQRVRLRLVLLDLVPEAQDLVRNGNLGVKYGYVMRDLDVNRQRIALRYLNQVDTPRLREFRQLCADLLAQQAQEAMFDMAAFMSEVQDLREAEAANRGERIIPVSEDLPGVRKASSVSQALERYIRDLLDGGHKDAAMVVGTVYRGLLSQHLVGFPKGPSPLIPGETLEA
jgi:ParB family chromosome partitioning protein